MSFIIIAILPPFARRPRIIPVRTGDFRQFILADWWLPPVDFRSAEFNFKREPEFASFFWSRDFPATAVVAQEGLRESPSFGGGPEVRICVGRRDRTVRRREEHGDVDKTLGIGLRLSS